MCPYSSVNHQPEPVVYHAWLAGLFWLCIVVVCPLPLSPTTLSKTCIYSKKGGISKIILHFEKQCCGAASNFFLAGARAKMLYPPGVL